MTLFFSVRLEVAAGALAELTMMKERSFLLPKRFLGRERCIAYVSIQSGPYFSRQRLLGLFVSMGNVLVVLRIVIREGGAEG